MEAEQPCSLVRVDSPVGRQPKAARQSCLTEQAGAAQPLTLRSGSERQSPHRGTGGERKRWHGQSAAAPVPSCCAPWGAEW